MSEWWTYTLSDIQSFSLHSYYRLFELYNRAIWPAPIAAFVLGLVILAVLGRPRPRSGWIVAAILTASWLWIAIAFHAHRYSTLTWTAKYFAWIFGLEAALLGTLGRAPFERRRAGLAIFAFALLVQPIAGLAFGRTWRQVEVFGVAPDATAVATIGVLLLASGRVRWELLVLPLVWLAVSGATLRSMEAPEGWVPIAMGVLGFSLAATQSFARRTTARGRTPAS